MARVAGGPGLRNGPSRPAEGMQDGTSQRGQPGTADTPWAGRLFDSAPDPAAERAVLAAQQPHGRLVSPDEIAHAAFYLASSRAGSTTGTEITVGGGRAGLRLLSRT